MKKLANYTVSVLLTLLVVVGFLAYSLWVERDKTEKVSAEGLSVSVVNEFNATSTYYTSEEDDAGYLTATSTWWMANGGVLAAWEGTAPEGVYSTTTSKTLDIDNISNITVGMFIVSTSSNPTIAAEVQISPDSYQWYDFIPTDIFRNTANASLSDATQIATSTLFTFTSGDGTGADNDSPTTTPSFSVDLRGTTAKWLRFKFGSNATTTLRTTYMLRPY